MDFEIDRELQAHGFDFTDPMAVTESPETESLSSDRVGRSPQDNSTQTPPQQQPNFSSGSILESFLLSPQNFSALRFDSNALTAENGTSFRALQHTNWSNYDVLDQSIVPADISGSMQQPSWPPQQQP